MQNNLDYNAFVGSGYYVNVPNLTETFKKYAKVNNENNSLTPDLEKEETVITYADAIERFAENGIYITVEPSFTFALANRVAFSWIISSISKDEPKIKSIKQEDCASFYLCLDDAILHAVTMLTQDGE